MVDRRPLHDAEPSAAFVFCVPLACAVSGEQPLTALLDSDETARAARFSTRGQWRRYVISHGVLRLILSAFTGRDPRAIRIARSARGKPYFVGPGPHFSLSHCGDVALVAVTRGGPTGIDVERIRPDLRLHEFARALVGAWDVARIEALAPETRTRAWFEAWTRLEAVAKASGNGLDEDSISELGEPLPFRTWPLDVDEFHVGALATAHSVKHVVYEAFPDVSSALARFDPS